MKRTIVTALLLFAFSFTAIGQIDPLAGLSFTADGELEQVGALVEYFEVDARLANKLARKYAASLSAAPLREELESMLDDGSAALVESCYAKSISGRRTKVVSADEILYPTEYDPPEIPQTATLTEAIAPVTAANPTAFDTQDVGASLEFEATILADGRTVDLMIAPRLVHYLGREYTVEKREGLAPNDPRRLSSTIYMPKFYLISQNTSVTVRDGDTVLLSVNRPHGESDKMIMVLLRVDVVK